MITFKSPEFTTDQPHEDGVDLWSTTPGIPNITVWTPQAAQEIGVANGDATDGWMELVAQGHTTLNRENTRAVLSKHFRVAVKSVIITD